MTPQEKAIELVQKFKPYSYYDGHDLTTRFQRDRSNIESAIECALIAVDDIIEEIRDYCDDSSHQFRMNFWVNVKSSIESM